MTRKHQDSSNVVHGLCTIFVFGDFTPTLSGHVVLHDAKIILEVIMGNWYVILLSNIKHSNICFIKADKNCQRQSIVHYTAGPLFQWLWDGRRLHKEVKDKEIDAYKGSLRFEELYNLLPTLKDLQDAEKTGVISDHDIESIVQSGKSYIMRPFN